MITEFLVLAIFPALLVTAGAYDLASYTIPNRIQLGLLGAFAICALLAGWAPGVFGEHLLAGFIGFVAGFTLFALGYIGGGDAKLFACAALWLGFHDLLEYAIVASLLGGGLTLGLLTMRRIPLPGALAQQGWIMRLHDEQSGVPYGVALAAGALLVLPYTELFRSAVAM
jgi:prepilin peptidase CpaA